MKKKLLIFDLDGTLMYTVVDLNIATNYALEKYHYPLRSVEQTRKDIGNGILKLIERSIPGGTNNKDYPFVLEEFKTYYKAHYFENSYPYPHIKETLIALKEKGYLLAVVSNKFNEGTNKMINHYLPNIFDRTQGSISELRYKPSSDLVNKVLSELSITPQEALYIGDTEIDYQTAVNSSLDCVLVSYGYRTKEELLKQTKNSPIISDIDELINLLD
ncbi:MAG: HAD family hydrolase [Bacilli bacterium]|nr:HAD family hydrolase [Bacilli bacterium]